MFKEVGSGVGRVEDGGSESGAGELGENLVTESFAHLFIHSVCIKPYAEPGLPPT